MAEYHGVLGHGVTLGWHNSLYEPLPVERWPDHIRSEPSTHLHAPTPHAPQPLQGFLPQWVPHSTHEASPWAPNLYPPAPHYPQPTSHSSSNAPEYTLPRESDPFSLLAFPNAAAVLHSSYGSYEPISGPYPRFLTPSPAPSVLEVFDEFDGDFCPPGAMWGGPGPNTAPPPDPFAGLAVGGSAGQSARPSDTNYGSYNLEQRRRDSYAAYELSLVDSQLPLSALPPDYLYHDDTRNIPPSPPPPQPPPHHTFASLPRDDRAMPQASNGFPPVALPEAAPTSFSPPPLTIPSVLLPSTSGVAAPQPGPQPDFDSPPPSSTADEIKANSKKRNIGKDDQDRGQSKKNRNPHATQLPGASARSAPKEEAGDGHEGPSCSHCASVSTPLWRRGPDDELLCNACGLYLKLHNRPRPQTSKAPKPSGASRGIMAQTLAAGVVPKCQNCEATSTPMWRKDVNGHLACNACSLYYKLHNVLRPISLCRKQKTRVSAAAARAAAVAAAQKAASTSSKSPRPVSPLSCVKEELVSVIDPAPPK